MSRSSQFRILSCGLAYHTVGAEIWLLFVRSETSRHSDQGIPPSRDCKPFNIRLLEQADSNMSQLLPRETNATFRQTTAARNQKELFRLQKQIAHLKSELTTSARRLEMWRTRALDAEAKSIDLDSLPEFLREVCRNTLLSGEQKKHRSWSASAMSLSFVFQVGVPHEDVRDA
jgi:hypothetical protein